MIQDSTVPYHYSHFIWGKMALDCVTLTLERGREERYSHDGREMHPHCNLTKTVFSPECLFYTS